jgi:hypothetical protein
VHRTALAITAICVALTAGCASRTSSTLATPPASATPSTSTAPPASGAAATPPVVSGSPSADLPASPSTSESTTSPSASTTVRVSTQLYGVIASGAQLVISYLGGDCDVSARGSATETAASIVVQVHVTSSDGICSAVGYLRSVTVQLNSPWNHRAIVDDTGATVPTVDGALLLQPSWLPTSYEADLASAGQSSDGSENAVAVTDYAVPTPSASPSGQPQCQPGPGDVQLEQGYGITPGYPPLAGAYALADGTAVTVDRDDQGLVGLYWTPPNRPAGWSVGLQASTRCLGDAPVPLTTLMRIANGLH